MRHLDEQRRKSQELAEETGKEIYRLLRQRLGSVVGRKKAKEFLLHLQERTGRPRAVVVFCLVQVPGLGGFRELEA